MYPSSTYVNCLIKRILVKYGVWDAGTKWAEGSGLPSKFGSSHGYGSVHSPDAVRPISLSLHSVLLLGHQCPFGPFGNPPGFPTAFFFLLFQHQGFAVSLFLSQRSPVHTCLPEASHPHPGCWQIRVFEHSSLLEFRKREQNNSRSVAS